MKTFNNEEYILECFEDVDEKETCLFGNFLACSKIYFSLKNVVTSLQILPT